MRNGKKKTTPQDVTISSLTRTVSNSFSGRTRVKLANISNRIRKFFHEYSLPAITSAVFVALVLIFSATRVLERTSIIALQNEAQAGGVGYNILLSDDEVDEFARQNSEPDSSSSNQSVSINSTQSVSNSFSLSTTPSLDDSSGDSPSGDTGGEAPGVEDPGGDPGGEDPGGEDPNPQPADPFTASINSFNQSSITLTCANPSKPKKSNCSKSYSFNAGILTVNGPGIVNYEWQSNISAGNGNGSFTAASVDSITSVNKEIVLSCKTSSNYTIQLVLLDPTFTNSTTIAVNHNCNEL